MIEESGRVNGRGGGGQVLEPIGIVLGYFPNGTPEST